jgi:probable HAF family extracellular repeat protein
VRGSERLLVPAGSARGTTEAFAPEYEFQGERSSRLRFRIGSSVGTWPTTMIDDRPRDDTRWPQTRILSGPPSDPPVSGPVSFTFEADEPGSTFECQIQRGGIDLGEPEPCTSPKTYTTLEGGEPSYSFQVRATDPAGNEAPTGASRSFSVAEPALPGPIPSAPALSEPVGFKWLSVGNVTLRGSSVPGATIEVVDGVVFGGPARYWRTQASPSGRWVLRVSQLTEGHHFLSVRASNRSGSSPSSRVQIQVDTQAPVPPTIDAKITGKTVVLEGKAEPGARVRVYDDGREVAAVWASTGWWSKTMTMGTEGHRFAVNAADNADNRSAMSDAVEVASGPPSYTYVPLGAFGTSVYAGSEGRAVNDAGQVAGYGNGNSPASLLAMRWQNGVMTNLGGVHIGGDSTVNAMNADGVVTGYMHVDRYTPPKAFVSRDGGLARLDDGMGPDSVSHGLAINDAGDIVGGRSANQGAPRTAVLWRDGVPSALPGLGGTAGPYGETSIANDINNRGQIVGTAKPPTGPSHAVLWEDGAIRDLGNLGGPDSEASQAFAINDRGQIVGSGQNAELEIEGFLWEDGEITRLGALGDRGSTPRDINERGDIVGYSNIDSGPLRPFLWRDGEMHDLNDLVTNLPDNVELRTALAINDNGVIVGGTCNSPCAPGKSQRDHGYVLIPTGQPVPPRVPALLDVSIFARPITAEGPSPTPTTGRYGDALRFTGGRLTVPRFGVPLQHRMVVYIKPDGNQATDQVIMDAGVATLTYDGAARKLTYTVTGANGTTASASTPAGKLLDNPKPLYVEGGVRKTGEVVVGIGGRLWSSGQTLSAIAPTQRPFSIGAESSGGRPFTGTIEYPIVLPGAAAATVTYNLPWNHYVGAVGLVAILFDADPSHPDRFDIPFVRPEPMDPGA